MRYLTHVAQPEAVGQGFKTRAFPSRDFRVDHCDAGRILRDVTCSMLLTGREELTVLHVQAAGMYVGDGHAGLLLQGLGIWDPHEQLDLRKAGLTAHFPAPLEVCKRPDKWVCRSSRSLL